MDTKAIHSRSFNEAPVMAILTDSVETMLVYVKLLWASTIWPPATGHAFLVKFSILIEKTMWHFLFWEPIGGLSSSSRILDATFTTLISFCIALYHRPFPFSLSNIKASSTVLGTLVPNFCVILGYLLLTAAMILCLYSRHGLSTRRMQVHHLYPQPLHIQQL